MSGDCIARDDAAARRDENDDAEEFHKIIIVIMMMLMLNLLIMKRKQMMMMIMMTMMTMMMTMMTMMLMTMMTMIMTRRMIIRMLKILIQSGAAPGCLVSGWRNVSMLRRAAKPKRVRRQFQTEQKLWDWGGGGRDSDTFILTWETLWQILHNGVGVHHQRAWMIPELTSKSKMILMIPYQNNSTMTIMKWW